MALEGVFHEADVLIGCSKDEGSIYAFGLRSTDYPSVNYSTYLGAIGEYLGLTDPLIIETVAYMYAEEVEVKKHKAKKNNTIFLCIGYLRLAPDSVFAY